MRLEKDKLVMSYYQDAYDKIFTTIIRSEYLEKEKKGVKARKLVSAKSYTGMISSGLEILFFYIFELIFN